MNGLSMVGPTIGAASGHGWPPRASIPLLIFTICACAWAWREVWKSR